MALDGGGFGVWLGGMGSGMCVRMSLVKGREMRGGGGGLVGGVTIEGLRKSSRIFVGMAEFGKSENVPLRSVSNICQGGTASIAGVWEIGLAAGGKEGCGKEGCGNEG